MEWIDLGLPSGTLWAIGNVGGFCEYGEAVSKYGSQLPTRAQFCELVDYTKYQWDDEMKGVRFIGKDGNEVFFPAAGFQSSRGGLTDDIGSDGHYWSCCSRGFYSFSLIFDSNGNIDPSADNYYKRGLSVRLVNSNKQY